MSKEILIQMNTLVMNAVNTFAKLPSTGEQSTLPLALGLLGLALVIFIVIMVLRRKAK